MGLMDKLWDDVFAGSQPAGNGKGFSPSSAASAAAADAVGSANPSSKMEISKLNIPDSSDILERTESSPPPSPSPSPHDSTQDLGRRLSVSEREEGGSMRGSASQKISINDRGKRLPSLDTALSLPNSYRYLPDILSPGSRRDDNVWRSVFHPGGGNRAAMDGIGAGKFDKADARAPSVYDWYNPLSSQL